jgi:hypothetical protein
MAEVLLLYAGLTGRGRMVALTAMALLAVEFAVFAGKG